MRAMDTLTFLSEIVRSVAWPITAIIVAYVFRGPLAKLMPLVRSLRVRDLEVTFGKELAKARAEIEEVPVSREDEEKERDKFTELRDLANLHPPAAIIESWKLIENELRQLAEAIDRPELAKTPAKVFFELRQDGRFGSNVGSLFNRLRRLRNDAAHESDFRVTEGQATEYVDLAESVAAFISAYRDRREGSRKT